MQKIDGQLVPIPAPSPSDCHFWLAGRMRYCNVMQMPQSTFCRFHDNVGGTRSPCAECGVLIAPTQVDSHQKKCPKLLLMRRLAEAPFYSENFNAGNAQNEVCSVAEPSSSKSGVGMLDVDTFLQLKGRIDRAFESLPACATASTDPIEADSFVRQDPQANIKHEQQQAAIAAHLNQIGALSADKIFVEMGAGKAFLLKMVRNHVDAECVALDNQKFRNVAERHCPGEQPFHRFRVDLLHANLAQIEPLRSSAHKHAVIVGKHVCGAATDFSLRALRVLVPGNQCPLGTPSDQAHLSCIDAIAIATCCHHRCEWKHFVNTPLFLQLGLTAADFHWMCAISSWAVCEVVERQPSRSIRTESAIDTDASDQSADQTAEHEKPESAGVSSLHANHRINQVLSPQERTQLGLRCKRLIDYGRVQYLSEQGYDSWLVSYVDSSITKENTLLLAVPKQAGQ